MMKTRNIFRFLACVSLFPLFLACEIGLGSSVDTETPVVEISTPPSDAVIRSDFAITGSWSDDGDIQDLTVSFKSLTTDASYGPFTADVSKTENSGGTWLCLVKATDETNPIPDGGYEITVTITDTYGHASKVNRNYTLDNTAPIVIIERPGTKLSDASSPDSYGQKITLEGQASDDNDVDHIDMQIYKDAECTTLLKTVTLNNVPPTISLEVASYENAKENDYSVIYGGTNVQETATQIRYCKIISYDSAQSYPVDGSAQTEKDLLGNSTETYYLKDDITLNNILSDDVKITDIYHMLNGQKSATNVLQSLASLAVTEGLFSLNPLNNPTFTVAGRTSLTKSGNDFNKEITTEYVIYKNSTVEIEVSAGLDGIALLTSSLRPYVIECDAYGNAKDGCEKIYLADFDTQSASATTYKWSNLSFTNDKTISSLVKVGNTYIFGVDGTDIQGNSIITQNNGYGFICGAIGEVTNTLTSIKINDTENISENIIYVPAKNPTKEADGSNSYTKIEIEGNVIVKEGLPDVVISVGANEDYTDLVSLSLKNTDKDTSYDSAANDEKVKYDYSATIYTNVFPNNEKDGELSLKVTATNGSNSSSDSKVIIYDVAGPTISEFSVSPLASLYDLFASQTGPVASDYLNGTVTLSVNIVDNYQVENAKIEWFQSSDGGNTWGSAIQTNNLTSFGTVSETFDTTKITDKNKVKILVTATDRAGNQASYEKIYTVDQTSDKPAILPDDAEKFNLLLDSEDKLKSETDNPNKQNYFDMSGSMSFKVYDDDGIDVVTAEFNASTMSKNGNYATETQCDFTLPSIPGVYPVKVTVKDVNSTEKTFEFYIRVVSDKPVVSATDDVSYVTTNTENVTSSPVNKIEASVSINSDQKPFTVKREILKGKTAQSAYTAEFTSTATSTSIEKSTLANDSPTFTDEISMTSALESGKYTVLYTVTDAVKNPGTASFDFYVDNSAPSVNSDFTVPSPSDSEKGAYTFKGTAGDGTSDSEWQSGVSKVEYKVLSGEEIVTSGTAGGTTDWQSTLDFSDWKEGQKTIYFRATDSAGNVGAWVNKAFWYDKSVPTATIASYVEKDGATSHALSQSETEDSRAFEYGYKFTLKGQASDTNAVESVTITQEKLGTGGTVEESLTFAPDSTSDGSWTAGNLPRKSDGNSGTTFAGDPNDVAPDGKYVYKVTVKDASGKPTTSLSQTLTVDSVAPTITIDAPVPASASTSDVKVPVISGSTYQFKATPNDANGSGVTYLYYAITNDATAPVTISDYTAVDSGDGIQWIEEKVLGTGKTATENVDLLEGHYYLHVKAVDKAGNLSNAVSQEFYVDQAAPVITAGEKPYAGLSDKETVSENGTDVEKVKITISGTISETNALKSLEITRSDAETSAKTVKTFTIGEESGNFPLTPASETWSFDDTFTIADGNTSQDKVYTYTITAVDIAGNTTSVTRSVQLDTVKPEIDTAKFVMPTASQTEEASFKFTGDAGSVTDSNTSTNPSSGFEKIDFIFSTSATAPKDSGYTANFTVTPGTVGTENSGKWTSLQSFANYSAVFGTKESPLQGKKYLWAKVYDKAGNSSDWAKVEFDYDTAKPTVTETSLGSNGTYKNSTFTLGGSASDTWGIDSVVVTAKEALEVTTSGDNATNKTWSSTITLKTDESTGKASSENTLEDGQYTFTITAKDLSGKTAVTSRTVFIDASLPEITSKETTNDSSQKITVNGEIWYNTRTIKVKVTPTDALSGISSVSYTTKAYSASDVRTDGDWTDLTKQTDGSYICNVTFDSDGVKNLYFKVTDKAGNVIGDKSDYQTMTFNIDSTAPASVKVYDENNSEVTGEILTQGKKDLVYYVQIDDGTGGVGVQGISLGKTYQASGASVTPVTESESSTHQGRYKITVPVKSQVTGSFYLSVSDKVNNQATYAPFSYKLDNQSPSVTLESPSLASDSTDTTDGLNGDITISGYAEDNEKVTKINLWYSFDSSAWYRLNATDDSIESGLSNSKETFSVKHKFSTATKMLTAPAGGAAENVLTLTDDSTTEVKYVWVKVIATDEAGNEGSTTRKICIDRNSDRPEIKFITVDLGTEMSSKNYVWMKNTTKLMGTVTDDDGVTAMQISHDGQNWSKITLSKTSWNFDIKDFFTTTAEKTSEEQANASHTLYFKVTDGEGNTYQSATSSGLTSVYLVGKDDNKYGTKDSGFEDSCLYLQIDTLNPTVTLIGGKIYSDDSDKPAEYTSNFTNVTLGGSKRTMEFKFTAVDGVGLEKAEGLATFTYKDASKTSQTKTVDAEVKAYDSSDLEIKDFTSTSISYFIAKFADLDLGETEGSIVVKVSGVDKAGNTSTQTAELTYDYKLPTITVKQPSTTQLSSGDVNVYGTLDESVSNLYYTLSTSDTVQPFADEATATASTSTITTWTGSNADTGLAENGTMAGIKPYFKTILNPSLNWFLYLDGATSDIETHDVRLNQFLINSGITTSEKINTTGDDKFTTIVNLYLWLKAVDANGNETVTNSKILVDPQGQRPGVSISYPSASDTNLGGIINVYGTAEPKGSNTMKYVWMQIVADQHVEKVNASEFTATGRTFGNTGATSGQSFSVETGDLDYLAAAGYSVYNMKTYLSELAKSNTPAKWTLGSSLASGYSASDYGILIDTNGSTGWSQKINTNSEFNTTDPVNVAIRVYAEDDKGNISTKEDRKVIFDAGSPVFSDVYMRQYSVTTKALKASKQYTDNMYVTGAWYFEAKVTDDEKIQSLKIIESDDNYEFSLIEDGSVVDEEYVTLSSDGKSASIKYDLIASAGATIEQRSIIIEASDGVNISKKTIIVNKDSQAPKLVDETDSNYSISKDIKQTNGFYKFGSQATENPVGSVNQSGLDFVAFYFKSDNYIYDVMWNKAANSGKNYRVSTSSYNKTSECLYWKTESLTQSATTTNSITISAANPNIHKGGLVKIAGVIYLISGVNDVSSPTVITIDGSLDVENVGSTADFAIASVVNNTIQESSSGTKITDSSSYGYGYYQSAANDDGDHMVEYLSSDGIWSASINSKNMPDGAVELCYVAFDKAGNYSEGTVSAFVKNNAPRIAGLTIKTDYNGDGKFDLDSEVIQKYNSTELSSEYITTKATDTTSAVYDPDADTIYGDTNRSNRLKTSMTLGSSTKGITILRGKTEIHPEIVGGNGGLYYQYADSKGSSGGLSGQNTAKPITNAGTTDYTVNKVDNPITMQLADLLTAGNYEVTSPDCVTFTIYDETSGSQAFDDTKNQKATITLYVGIKAAATTAPTVKINPFHWTSFADNSIYGSNSETTFEDILGHIELEADLPEAFTTSGSGVNDRDPKVSGQIVITGTAHDDVRIQKLYFCIPGMEDVLGTDMGITDKDTSTDSGSTYYCLASESNGKITGVDSYADNGIKLEITKDTYSESGHDISWALSWNTQKHKKIADTDVAVKVLAQNIGTPAATKASTTGEECLDGATNYTYTYSSQKTNTPGSTQTSKTAETAYYKMDIVPYIQSLSTSLTNKNTNNPSVYGRTALGKYPVNFYKTSSAGKANVGETYTINGFNLGTNTSATISSTSTSKAISVTVNSIESLNNINNNSVEYNKQPNGVNNDNLTDDVEILVWNINSRTKSSSKGTISDVRMHVSPKDGSLGYSYIHNGDLTFNLNGQNSTNAISTWDNSSFIFDRNGKSWGMYAGTDSQSGRASNFKLAYSGWNAPDGDYYNSTTRNLESMGYKDANSTLVGASQRFGTPELAASTAGDRLYLMYYDTIYDELKFRAGDYSSYTSNVGDFGDFTDNGTWWSFAETNYKYVSVVANNAETSLYGPGAYYSIAVVSNSTASSEVVVAVWFDDKRNSLWYSYLVDPINKNHPTETNAVNTNWNKPVKILDGNAAGSCAIAVDSDSHVHIVSQTSNYTGSLYYTYLDTYSSTPTSVLVDSYGSSGEYLTIDFAKTSSADGSRYVPYIGYFDTSNQLPKYAYLVDTTSASASTTDTWAPKAGVDSDGKYTGAWEEIILPTGSQINPDDINIGVCRDSSTGVITTLKGPASTANPVLGYGILYGGTGYVETAQIK